MSDFLAEASKRTLLCDGAMGTMLHSAGHTYDGSLTLLNVSKPEIVATVHESYIAAGADVVQTNTFGASRLRLALYGQSEAVRSINLAGVAIARQAADTSSHPAFVAGSVSPAVTVGQRSAVTPGERVHALREQMWTLEEGGVDLFILETFGHLDELVEAVEVASEFGLPIVAQATFSEDGVMASGHVATDLATVLADLPVDVIGANCTIGPRRLLTVMGSLASATILPLCVQPNAGLPERTWNQRDVRFRVEPDYFASFVRPFVEVGAVLIGGCCGTTPTTIRAMAEQLPRTQASRAPVERPRIGARHLEATPGESLRSRARRGDFLVAVELPVPRVQSPEDSVLAAERLLSRGVTLLFIPLASQPSPRMSQLSFAIQLRQRLEVDTILSVSSWMKSPFTLQAEMLGAHALDIVNLLSESQEHLWVGDYPVPEQGADLTSLDLVTMLSNLNSGRHASGLPLNTTTDFMVGARCHVGGLDLKGEISGALAAVRAGANLLLTTPLYEPESLKQLRLALSGQDVSLLATIRPLRSEEEAEYLYHEVPDVTLPREYLDAFKSTNVPEKGLDLAQDLLHIIRPLVDGVVLAGDLTELSPLVDLAVAMQEPEL